MLNQRPQERPFNLDPASSSGELNVVIETPRNSRLKYKYDEQCGVFRLHKVLPTGTVFPFDFGFLPATRAEDGDPLDVLVLIEEPLAVGCIAPTRLIGVIAARQTVKNKATRNDRLIGVASTSHLYRNVRSLRGLMPGVVEEIERFFVFYNQLQEREFKVLGRYGAARARKAIVDARAHFAKAQVGTMSRRVENGTVSSS